MKMTSIFKKTWIFAIAIAMVLLMVVAIVPAVLADNSAEPAVGPEHVATNISLSGDVKLIFYYTYADIGFNDGVYTAKATVKDLGKDGKPYDKTVTFTEADFERADKDSTERIRIKVPLSYGQQAETVTVQWYKDGEAIGSPTNGSVKEYVADVRAAANDSENAQKEAYQKIAEPLVAMLNSGAKAQELKNFNTNNLANAGLFTDGSNPIDGMGSNHFYDMTPDRPATSGASKYVEFKATEVVLDSKVRLKVYLDCHDEEGVYKATVRMGDQTQNVKISKDEATGYRYVSINNISPIRFNERFTITVTDADGESVSYSCGVLDWARSTIDSSVTKDEQKNVARSLYLLYSYFTAYQNPDYSVGPKETDGDGKPVLDQNAECSHLRKHLTETAIVCSDCGYATDKVPNATRLSVEYAIAGGSAINAGTPTAVDFIVNVAGDVDISTLIFTLVPSSGMTLSDGEIIELCDDATAAFGAEAAINVVLDTANPFVTNEKTKLVKVRYTVTANDAGTYTVNPVVREASSSAIDDTTSLYTTSAVSIKVDNAVCTEHKVSYLKFTEGGVNKHTSYCSECNTMLGTTTCSYKSSNEESLGYLIVNSGAGACECGRIGEGGKQYKYKLGFSVEKDDDGKDVITENVAPLVVVTPDELANRTIAGGGSITLSSDGSYATVSAVANKSDQNFYLYAPGADLINAGTEPETGRYIAIKYRTTGAAGLEMWAGANNGRTAAAGGENFYINPGNMYVNNGEWQVMILDLSAVQAGGNYAANDDGKYYAHYVRWDVETNNNKPAQTIDIAYVAMSDDLMSLASFAGNDVYRFSATKSDRTISGTYMGSTKTLNPVFDGYWLTYTGQTGGNTVSLGNDNGISYADFDRKGTSSDCYVNLIGNTTYKAYTTTSATKYMALMYRTDVNSQREIYATSLTSYANGAGERAMWVSATNDNLILDKKWHFGIYNLSESFKNDGDENYFDPTQGLSFLRYDYYNHTNSFEGDIIDIAYIAVFDSYEQAYEYLGEQFAEKLGDNCQHDATYKSTEDCATYCEYCGKQTKEAEHTFAEDSKFIVSSTLNAKGELYETNTCTACGGVVERTISFRNGIDGFYINDTIANKGGNGQQTSGIATGKNTVSHLDANTTFINKDTGEKLVITNNFKICGWTGLNGGIERYVFSFGDGKWYNLNGTPATNNNPNDNHIGQAIYASIPDTVNSGVNSNFQGKLTFPAEILQQYVGQENLTLTFAAVPAACPGTADNPNTVTLLTISNVNIECDHVVNNTNPIKIDTKNPQFNTTDCSACGETALFPANATVNGGVAYIGGSNLSVTKTYTKMTETYGDKLPMSFIRINSTGSSVEERTYVLQNTSTYITTKRYVAMMWRSTVSSAPEISLDTTSNVQRAVNQLNTTTNALAPVGEWHFGIKEYADHASYSLNGTDTIHAGARSICLDYINGSVARTKDDYVDVAFVAFFDSASEAWEYYNLYAAAYLSEDECQHFARSEDCSFVAIGDGKMTQHCACGKAIDESYCQHSDFDKLTNVQAVTNDSVTDYIADCGVCGATGVEVDISTPGGLQFYNAGRLQSIMNANTDSLKYNLDYPILKDENGIPYLHAVDNVGHENYMYLNYGGDTNLTNVGKFFAVMYKNTVPGVDFQLYLNTPGTINHTGAKCPTSGSLDASGKWSLAIIDYSTWGALGSEAGWVRFDFIDNLYAKGNSVDIAWAGFFNTLDEANEYYAAYLDKYSVEEHVCAADHDWKMGDDIFTYTKVCTVCGKEMGEAQTNISEHGKLAWSPEAIKNLSYSENTSLKTLTLMEDEENGGLPFLRIKYTTETSAENFLWLNKAATKKYNAGKVVAFIYRNSGGGIRANEMFCKYDDGIGSGNNKYSYNYMKASSNLNSTNWSLGYFDFTNNDSYDAWNGLGAMRLDVANGGTVKVGDYLDIAAVVTFNTVDEAIEFYDKVANMYDFDAVLNRICFNKLNVGGTAVASAAHTSNNVSLVYDASTIKVSSADAKCINTNGWYLNPYGTEGYYYRVIDENGDKGELQFIHRGTQASSAILDVGKGLGYTEDKGEHGSFAFSLNYDRLTAYEGQTITVQLIAKHNTGREAVIATIKNVTVCAHDVALTAANYHPVIENDGNADGKLYEAITCPTCGAEFKRVLAFQSWTDYTRINGGDGLGSIGNGGTKDLASQSAATPATTVQIAGWIATNGGVKAYYYRVNGGEWIKTDGCSAGTLGNNILTYVGDAFYNYAAGGLHNGGTGISTKDLTTDYAGQVVKIEFGAVPLNNPGTDEAPNVFTFATVTNVQVATPTVAAEEPNYVIDANALKGTTEHTGLTYALDASGDFVTYTQKTDGSSDCYFYATFPNASVNVPSAPTGKYVLVKYRTTYTGSWQMFVGANWENYTTAQGGDDSFGLNVNNGSNNGAIIADGEWQYLILDLKFVEAWGGVNPEDGTTDTYQIDYFRIDPFNSASNVANTVDIAYIAYADSVDKLVDYAGMTSYTFGDSYSGGVVGQTVVVGE